jgi:hypothetical protein
MYARGKKKDEVVLHHETLVVTRAYKAHTVLDDLKIF